MIRGNCTEHLSRERRLIETSVITGHGLDELRQILTRELSSLTPQRDLGKPRLFVDRAFSLRGIGTVVTGTLTGGKLTRGQTVILQPQNVSTRVRTIQSHNREQNEVGPGTRVALNLPDIENDVVKRGDVVTILELGQPVSTIDVVIGRSRRLPVKTRAIKNSSLVSLHHGATRVAARVIFAAQKNLGPGEDALAQLRLESPIFAFIGDRFVLRDSSERRTIAGGIVLDIQTNREQFREEKQREFLAARAKAPDDLLAAVRSELRRDGAKAPAAVLLRSNFTTQQVNSSIDKLVAVKELVRQNDIVANAKWWTVFCQRAANAIGTEHEKSPHLPGLDLAILRTKLENPPVHIFDALIIDLCRNGYAKTGTFIKRSGHHVSLPAELAAPAEKIRRLIAQKSFDPPARKEIASDAAARQALGFLIKQGELIELGPDLVLSAQAFAEMKAAVIAFIAKNGAATVSQLRQELQTSRRVMVPFLERLDRDRVTRRVAIDERCASKS